MLRRVIVAFIALPGAVAFAIPLVIAGWRLPPLGLNLLGLVMFVPGLILLVSCVREFYVVGLGTLAPSAPPKYLVVTGPYRYCRNPMYLGVDLVLFAWAVLYGSTRLLLYATCVSVAFHLRVVLVEEPRAARIFGDRWSAYRGRTPRWLPIRVPP